MFIPFHEYHVLWSTLTDLAIAVLDHHPAAVMNSGGGDLASLFSKNFCESLMRLEWYRLIHPICRVILSIPIDDT